MKVSYKKLNESQALLSFLDSDNEVILFCTAGSTDLQEFSIVDSIPNQQKRIDGLRQELKAKGRTLSIFDVDKTSWF